MIVRELVTKLGFETDSSELKKYEAGIASAKAQMKALSVVVGGAVGALFGIAKTTANHGEEADKLSQRLGVSAERYQELAHAANMSDVATESFTMSMQVLNRTIFAARQGSNEASTGFQMLGGDVLRLAKSGASTDEVLLAISDRFKNIKDPIKKAALAQQLFGRAGAQMVPMLNKGSEGFREAFAQARAYGLVLDQETIDASNRFNDGLKLLKGQVIGLKNAIGSGLVKTMAPLIEELIAFIDANRDLIKQNLTSFIEGLVDIVSVAASALKKILNLVVALVRPIGGLGTALKYVVAGFAAFKALQLAASLGTIVMALSKAVTAWRLFGAAGLFAQMQVIAIPLLIGAAIIALGLLIEDVIGFFNGKDSLVGSVIESFKKNFPEAISTIKTALESASTWFKGFFDYVMQGVDWMLAAFTKIGQVISAIGGGIGSAMSTIGGLTSGLFGGDATNVPGSGAASQRTLNNSMNAPITINMGEGTQFGQAEKVGSSVYNSLDDLLRDSSKNLSTQVAY